MTDNIDIQDLKIGDIVQIKHSKYVGNYSKPVIIEELIKEPNGSIAKIEARYINSTRKYNFGYHNINNYLIKKCDENMNNSLYKIVETGDQVKVTGTHSSGDFIVEYVESGKITTFPVSDLEEVVPYTVAMKPVSKNGNLIHYIVNERSFEVSDLVLIDNVIYIVCKLDTKSKTAKSIKKVYKIQTELVKI